MQESSNNAGTGRSPAPEGGAKNQPSETVQGPAPEG